MIQEGLFEWSGTTPQVKNFSSSNTQLWRSFLYFNTTVLLLYFVFIKSGKQLQNLKLIRLNVWKKKNSERLLGWLKNWCWRCEYWIVLFHNLGNHFHQVYPSYVYIFRTFLHFALWYFEVLIFSVILVQVMNFVPMILTIYTALVDKLQY